MEGGHKKYEELLLDPFEGDSPRYSGESTIDFNSFKKEGCSTRKNRKNPILP